MLYKTLHIFCTVLLYHNHQINVHFLNMQNYFT